MNTKATPFQLTTAHKRHLSSFRSQTSAIVADLAGMSDEQSKGYRAASRDYCKTSGWTEAELKLLARVVSGWRKAQGYSRSRAVGAGRKPKAEPAKDVTPERSPAETLEILCQSVLDQSAKVGPAERIGILTPFIMMLKTLCIPGQRVAIAK